MDKLNEVIGEINLQGKNYTKFSNNWNVMQQLIDILAYMPESARLFAEFKIKEMQLTALVQKDYRQEACRPMKVMEEICDFYKIECLMCCRPSIESSGSKRRKRQQPDQRAKSKQVMYNLMELL